MPITYDAVKSVTSRLYEWSLKKIPEDSKVALRAATITETGVVARRTLMMMLESADAAEKSDHLLCSDSGIPVYSVRIGTRVQFVGNIRQAITEGFEELVKAIRPPILLHVTNPLTNERDFKGKGMPIVSFDLIDDANYVEIVCSPQALGSGRWAALEIFSYPSLEVIEKFVLETVIRAGSQPCPPVVVGVGIGGTFDTAARMSKEATLRPLGEENPEPILASMEARLVRAINQTGFGPMGTGGDTTALGVHINYSSGHGFTPVAVSFNCWINRRTRARIYDKGEIVRCE